MMLDSDGLAPAFVTRTKKVDFVPHPACMTDSGEVSLDKFTHALAELIDNSIEATALRHGLEMNKERKVTVDCLFTPTIVSGKNEKKVGGYLVVCDNGGGMNEVSLTRFATYALSKEVRGETGATSESSSIGKYGVGAKQSAFWLGDRIHILTKPTVGAPVGHENDVLEFVMARDHMEGAFEEHRRAQEAAGDAGETEVSMQNNAYCSDMKWRHLFKDQVDEDGNRVSNCDILAPEDERNCTKLMEIIRRHESACQEGFTAIVIKLKPKIVARFFVNQGNEYVKYLHFPTELAQIYYFHLHPEHHPLNIDKMPKFRGKAFAGSKALGRGQTNRPATSNLKILLSVHEYFAKDNKWLADIDSCDIGEVKDAPPLLHIANAEAVFRFSIDILKPNCVAIGEKQSKVEAELAISGRNESDFAKVLGMVFYLPFKDGRETRPLPSKGGDWHRISESPTNKPKAASSSSTLSQSSLAGGGPSRRRRDDDDDDDDDDEKGDTWPATPMHDNAETDQESPLALDDDEKTRRDVLKDEKIFDIYWSDRHVCMAGANKFEWMPSAVTSADCEKAQLPFEWRDRIKGYLFFQGGTGPDAWDSIANNKLNLTVAGMQLDEYVSQGNPLQYMKERHRDNKAPFAKFLKESHKLYDKVFKSRRRHRELEKFVAEKVQNNPKAQKTLEKIAFFRECGFTQDMGVEETLRVGDCVKLYMNSNGTMTKKIAGGLNEHFAQIVAFSDMDQTTQMAEQFDGSPMVHFLRLPLALHHPDLVELSKQMSKDDFIPPMEALFAHKVKIGALDLSKAPFKLTSKELKQNHQTESKKILEGVKFFLYPSVMKVNSNDVVWTSEKVEVPGEGEFQVKSDAVIYKFGFQIVDVSNRVRIRPPAGVDKPRNYYIRYEIDSGDSQKNTDRDEKQLYWWDDINGSDVETTNVLEAQDFAKRVKKAENAKPAEEVYFSVFGFGKSNKASTKMKLNPGRHRIKITVLEDVKLIDGLPSYQRKLTVNNFVLVVDKSGVHSCKIEVEGLDVGKITRSIGSLLPRTEITLLDAQKMVARVATAIRVGVKATRKKDKKPFNVICYTSRVPVEDDEKDNEGFPILSDGSGVLDMVVATQNIINEMDAADESLVLGLNISQEQAFKAWDRDREERVASAPPGTSKDKIKKMKQLELFDMLDFAKYSPLELYDGTTEGKEEWFKRVENAGFSYHTTTYGCGGGWRIDYPLDGSFLASKDKDWKGGIEEFTIDINVEIQRPPSDAVAERARKMAAAEGRALATSQLDAVGYLWEPLGNMSYVIDFKDCHKVCTVRQVVGASPSKAGGRSAISQASTGRKRPLEADDEAQQLRTSDGRLIVHEGRPLPPLSFKFFDRYGILSAPKPVNIGGKGHWGLVMAEHPLIEGFVPEDTTTTTSSSVATFTHLTCRRQDDDQDPIPDTGLESSIRVHFVDDIKEYCLPWKETAEWLRQKYRNETDWEPEHDPLDVFYDQGLLDKPELKKFRRAYSEYANEQAPPYCDVPLLIMPDRSPRAFKIFWGEQEVGAMAGGLSVTSGEPVTDLSLRLYDVLDQELDIDPEWFSAPALAIRSKSQGKRNKAAVVTVSWATSISTLDVPVSDKPLRSVELPDVPASLTKSCGKQALQVVLVKWGLLLDFELRVRPGAATNWKLAVREDLGEEGLVSGSSRDFAAKILFVSQSDADMREVPCPSSGPAPMPQVLVYASDPSRPSGRAKSQRRGKPSGVPRGHQIKRRRAQDDDDDDDDDDDEEIRSIDEDEESRSPKRKNTPPLPFSGPDHALLSGLSSKARLSMQHAARQGLPVHMDMEEYNDSEGGGSRSLRRDDGDDDDDGEDGVDDSHFDFDDSELVPIATLYPVLHSAASMQQDGREREEGYFYFPSSESISLPYSEDVEHRYVWVVIKDSSKRLQACMKRIELTNDIPHALQVRAPALGLADFSGASAGGLLAHVSSFSQKVNVEVLVVDKDGLPAHAAPSSRAVKNLKVTLVSSKASSKPVSLAQVSRSPLIYSAVDFNAFALFAPPKPPKGKVQKKKSREADMEVDAEQGVPEAPEGEPAVPANPQLVFSGQFRNAAGEDEDLVGVALTCQRRRVNNVVKMQVVAASRAAAGGDAHVDAEVDCGATLPDLFLAVQTDDAQPYIPAVKQVECTVHFSEKLSGSKRSSREPSQLFRGGFEVDEERGGLSISFLDPSDLERESWEVGYLFISFTYTETRVFEGVPATFAPVSETFTVKVVASSPQSLVPADAKTENRLNDNLTVSNSPGQSSIARLLHFKAVDRFGNDARMDVNFTFYCTVRHLRPDPDVGITALPHIKGADSQGYISATPSTADLVSFGPLDFEVELGSGSGSLELVFGTSDIHGMVEYVSRLTFTDDAERMKKEGEKQREWAELRDMIEAYEVEKRALEAKKDEETEAVGDLLSGALTGLKNEEPDNTPSAFDVCLEKIKKEITGMQHDAKNRRVVKENFLQPKEKSEYEDKKRKADEMPRDSIRGMVARVGYVQNKQTAEVLSWIAGPRMMYVIAQNAAVQQELVKQKISSFSVMNSPTFTVKHGKGELRVRNDAEKRSKQLPNIAPVSYPGTSEPVKGNPQAIVNILQLADKDEDLRDTIFFNIFGKGLLFDTFSDATEYHSRVCAHNRKHLGALSLIPVYGWQDGVLHKMGADGSQDYRNGILRPDAIEKLSLVFGEMPPSLKDASFKNLQSGLSLAKNSPPLSLLSHTLLCLSHAPPPFLSPPLPSPRPPWLCRQRAADEENHPPRECSGRGRASPADLLGRKGGRVQGMDRSQKAARG